MSRDAVVAVAVNVGTTTHQAHEAMTVSGSRELVSLGSDPGLGPLS